MWYYIHMNRKNFVKLLTAGTLSLPFLSYAATIKELSGGHESYKGLWNYDYLIVATEALKEKYGMRATYCTALCVDSRGFFPMDPQYDYSVNVPFATIPYVMKSLPILNSVNKKDIPVLNEEKLKEVLYEIKLNLEYVDCCTYVLDKEKKTLTPVMRGLTKERYYQLLKRMESKDYKTPPNPVINDYSRP
jgi:hypothetical protein